MSLKVDNIITVSYTHLTHDRELTDMLNDKYEFRYFAENVDKKNGMTFDYKIDVYKRQS